MTSEIHEGPLEASRTFDAPAKLSWREKRYQRRRRRVWFEEVLGWVLVPVILLGCYWLLNLGLNAVGTSPAAIMEGIDAIISSL
ncbi:hypothetical protein HPT29_012075 [Microvirga terrae]|uniref:ABC transporter permease n=1 Tax=Microvirga terrae TaxID=2740529 RepID=A0ABY5RX04_9HYPH|nr:MULTISPECIES: hypothetical protein [Microvirga]MBQ0824344.1 hypothetical protein [Microvirga sp. HBU67558]UVF21791.1 hypothetical protein HPT29_012075 [Microvirga terrae]